jgi:hypothetical protein
MSAEVAGAAWGIIMIGCVMTETVWAILVPFDAREVITLRVAAERANKSESTMRSWCVEHGIGRRVGDGPWNVSRVALAMFLDGYTISNVVIDKPLLPARAPARDPRIL